MIPDSSDLLAVLLSYWVVGTFEFDGVMQKVCADQNWQKSKIWHEKHVLAHILIYIACL